MVSNLKRNFETERRKLETQEAEAATRVNALCEQLQAESARLQEIRIKLAYVTELYSRFGIDRLTDDGSVGANGREPQSGRQAGRTTARELIRSFIESHEFFTADDVVAHVQQALPERQADSIKSELGYWRRQEHAYLDEESGVYWSLKYKPEPQDTNEAARREARRDFPDDDPFRDDPPFVLADEDE